jgi:hypothetical protein
MYKIKYLKYKKKYYNLKGAAGTQQNLKPIKHYMLEVKNVGRGEHQHLIVEKYEAHKYFDLEPTIVTGDQWQAIYEYLKDKCEKHAKEETQTMSFWSITRFLSYMNKIMNTYIQKYDRKPGGEHWDARRRVLDNISGRSAQTAGDNDPALNKLIYMFNYYNKLGGSDSPNMDLSENPFNWPVDDDGQVQDSPDDEDEEIYIYQPLNEEAEKRAIASHGSDFIYSDWPIEIWALFQTYRYYKAPERTQNMMVQKMKIGWTKRQGEWHNSITGDSQPEKPTIFHESPKLYNFDQLYDMFRKENLDILKNELGVQASVMHRGTA